MCVVYYVKVIIIGVATIASSKLSEDFHLHQTHQIL